MPGRRPGASLGLGPLDSVIKSAAPAADLITASKSFREGCASSPLDHDSPKLVQKSLKMFSTRIKDAGIAIRHSRGGILFYTAGSRNGLKGWTSGLETTKIVITRHIRIPKIHSTREIRYQGGAKPLGPVPSSKTAWKRARNPKMRVWARKGNFTLVGAWQADFMILESVQCLF